MKNLIFFKKLILIIPFIIIFWLSKPTDKAFSDIVTFISIATGFSITSLSIITTSSFSRKLSLIDNSKNRSETLLHTLVWSFRNAIYLFTFTICLIFSYKYVDEKTYTTPSGKWNIDLMILFIDCIWYLTVLSVIKFLFLVNIFVGFVLQTAKRS